MTCWNQGWIQSTVRTTPLVPSLDFQQPKIHRGRVKNFPVAQQGRTKGSEARRSPDSVDGFSDKREHVGLGFTNMVASSSV